jgi:hypothetical protein
MDGTGQSDMTAFGTGGRKAGQGGKWIRPERRLAILVRDGFTCMYCGRNLKDAPPAEVTLDHLVPCSKGGTNQSDNLVCACRSCNSSRGSRDLSDFAPGGALDRIAVQRYLPVNLELAKAILSDRIAELVADVECGDATN